MGLDSVELAMAWEEEFGLRIPDDAAEQMLTPRHVIDWMCTQHRQGGMFTSPDSRPPPGFQDWTREQIAERVRAVIREQLAVVEFSDDDRFVEDLRMD